MRNSLLIFQRFSGKLKISLGFILLWLLVTLLAPYLAQEGGGLIPYLPSTIDFQNSNTVSPFAEQEINATYYRHWLGTDELGRDVLANLIHGSRTAFFVGFGAVALAALIGIILGSLAAFFGDDKLKLSWVELIVLAVLKLVLLLSLVLFPWQYATQGAAILFGFTLLLYIGIAVLLYRFLKRLAEKKSWKKISYPVDLIIGRMIETLDALPLLFVLIVLAAVVEPSIYSTILIIGLTGWAGIARFSRAELMKVKQLDYVESGRALGLKSKMIVLKHMLPNALPPILITLAFGVSAAILIESTLSFLGLGISTETASWGKLLAEARENYSAWWIALFPGLAIFFSVLSCNIIGEELGKGKFNS